MKDSKESTTRDEERNAKVVKVGVEARAVAVVRVSRVEKEVAVFLISALCSKGVAARV